MFLDAGKYAYETWHKDKTQADLTSYWIQVKELEDKIAVQEEKKKEMTDRYDEEISLIASNLSAAGSNSSEGIQGTAFCPNCGASVAKGDIFCQGCGAKLQ